MSDTASNTLHADLRLVFYPGRYAPGAEAVLHATVTARPRRHYALLEAVIGQDWFGGTEPSILDVYVAATLRWAVLYAPGGAWFDPGRLEGRASVLAAARSEGLGSAPFSRPTPCQPPEGSATG